MKNQNTTQIAYIVTADYYTNGKPTTCKITVQPVNFDPARLIDWSDRISKTHIREVENFTTPEEAAKRMTEIIEAAADRRVVDSYEGEASYTDTLTRHLIPTQSTFLQLNA